MGFLTDCIDRTRTSPEVRGLCSASSLVTTVQERGFLFVINGIGIDTSVAGFPRPIDSTIVSTLSGIMGSI
jgi:hypothetical protein